MYEAGVASRGSRSSRSRQLAATSRELGTCLWAREPAGALPVAPGCEAISEKA